VQHDAVYEPTEADAEPHARREWQQSRHSWPRGTEAVLSARDRRRMAPVVRSRTTSAPKPVRKTGTRIPRIRRSPGTGRPLSSTDPGTGARAGVPGFGSMVGRSGAVRGGADSGANVLGAGGGTLLRLDRALCRR
jgi:hypothetical protein